MVLPSAMTILQPYLYPPNEITATGNSVKVLGMADLHLSLGRPA